MEADKENVNRLKPITRIPLPVDPLPALPKHLVETKKKSKDMNERYPLKTLKSQQNLALPGPSNVQKQVDVRPKIRIDTRHVTRRARGEVLDWDYKVFKDSVAQDENVILISDDEDASKKDEFKFFVSNKQKSCLGETKDAATPILKCLEPNRVKNLKRSLKRTHSRELQGLSPLDKEQKRVQEKKRPKNHSCEPLNERLMSPDFLKRSYMACHIRDYASDTFNYLLSVEKKQVTPRISNITRACVINWLIKVNGADGNPAIVQTAVWYLDSVLATGLVLVNQLQLVAAACYWIAHKLHGPGICVSKLVRCSDHAFTVDKLLRAEKAVLQKLKFPSQPVVAQEFITYFSWWCDQCHPGEIEVAATFLCMCGLMVDTSLCNECPSVVGAAAVRNALLLLGKKELMIRLMICPIYRSAEKKATDMSYTCSVLRRAACTVGGTAYEYKAPYLHFGISPYFIAQRLISAANQLNVMDIRNTTKNH